MIELVFGCGGSATPAFGEWYDSSSSANERNHLTIAAQAPVRGGGAGAVGSGGYAGGGLESRGAAVFRGVPVIAPRPAATARITAASASEGGAAV
jgi:hypothetical protein